MIIHNLTLWDLVKSSQVKSLKSMMLTDADSISLYVCIILETLLRLVKFSESVQSCAEVYMLKACDTCADMGQI